MKLRHDLATLAIGLSVDGEGVERGPDGLPVAFRLFRAGPNETTKGTFIFDAAAAESVMSAAKAYGNDLAIDLEHASLDPDAPNWDPDARGYFNLELRNGELWAVNVRWSPDGERRLREKTQRYISPAFPRNPEARVTEIVNIALVAQPATYSTPALVAAGHTTKGTKMTSRDRLVARLSLAKSKIAKLAAGDPSPAEGEPAPGKFAQVQEAAKAAVDAIGALDSVKGVDDGMDAMAAAIAAMDTLENAIKALQGAPADADAQPAPVASSDKPVEDPQKMSRVERENEQLRAALAAERHEKEVVRLAAQTAKRAEIDRGLVGRQVTLTPAAMKALAKLSLEDVEMFAASVNAAPVALGGPSAPVPGGSPSDGSKVVSTSRGPVTLTANQLAECKRFNVTPEAYAESLARNGAKR